MSWIELSLHATHEAVDWVCTLLSTAHFMGDIQISNYTSGENWAFTLCLYLPNDRHARNQVDAIAALLSSLHRTEMTTALEIAVLEERPTQINPFVCRIGQRFAIVNSAQPVPLQPEDIPLQITTSLSFGSGFHPATRLSLQLLERYVSPNMQALDLGSGSGILSVAMAKLGANVLALDNDAIAVDSTQAAVNLNHVTNRVTVRAGSLGIGSGLGHWMGGETQETVDTFMPEASFDLIAANIFARVHIALASDFKKALRPSGLLIAAGFTDDRTAEVSQALEEVGFEAIETQRLDEWVALAYRLKG
ncbi:50S ribosomal protein L11 methyltransferase [Phormidesmis priestleyi]